MKGFIVDEKYIVVAKTMKNAIMVAIERNIIHEEEMNIKSLGDEFSTKKFYSKVGKMNDLDSVKSLLNYYQGESISLRYNGEFIISEETIESYLSLKKDETAVLLCAKTNPENFGLSSDEECWMKIESEAVEVLEERPTSTEEVLYHISSEKEGEEKVGSQEELEKQQGQILKMAAPWAR